MTFKDSTSSRHKLTAIVAAGTAAIAVATGSYAIANSGSGSGTSPPAAIAAKVI
ncbi:MAG: hypothetical protein QOJ46_1963, partial [bacterium]